MEAQQTHDADPPSNTPQFNALAGRTMEGMKQMAEALVDEFKDKHGGNLPMEALPAMVSGVLCQAVEFYFNTNLLVGIPISVAHGELVKMIDDYWKQSVTGHLTLTARQSMKKGKAGK